jgi:uridine kinase
VRRGQEGLDADATRQAYETIYFAAQRVHLRRDQQHAHADLVLPNDE